MQIVPPVVEYCKHELVDVLVADAPTDARGAMRELAGVEVM
jgi:hypothetical protein